ncbi:MAG: dihydropteroate synthase, partial [Flammeovirgaceae bacterium]|nr:dihydropteroate synthase [Flammeovirgaceae bacterium]MDW8286773.1 dihydropteroate synthase [Flammeovirgaceae bacterium]
CRGRILSLERPIVMGILNLTPDSFYEGSRVREDEVLNKASRMLEEGATILDVGGYSTRPNASEVSLEEELQRVIPAIEQIHTHFPEAIISVDTFRAKVAEQAVQAGASIVNDISGGQLDSLMIETVGKLNVPYVLMHSRGTPQTMMHLNQYDNILNDILNYFLEKIEQLRQHRVTDIILDLGFGFAKNIEQNFYLLKHQAKFSIVGLPILTGISRKSMIYKTLGISPEEALHGTSVLHLVALQQGANILRVHDVKEAVQVIRLWEKLLH